MSAKRLECRVTAEGDDIAKWFAQFMAGWRPESARQPPPVVPGVYLLGDNCPVIREHNDETGEWGPPQLSPDARCEFMVAVPAIPHELNDHVEVAKLAMDVVNEATGGALREASIGVEVKVLLR